MFAYYSFLLAIALLLMGCDDESLAESSFGKMGESSSKASAASVISMGRDDEGGRAIKWHIGGND